MASVLHITGELSVNKYLLSLMVLLPLSMTTAISAQEEESEDAAVEEVVTTGIRSSLIDAISIKRDNVGVVDAITACLLYTSPSPRDRG